MTTQVQSLPHLDHRLIYGADAVLSLGMGIVLMAFAGPLTALTGWSLPPAFFLTIGALLLPWAAFNTWIARTARPSTSVIRGNLFGDASWVIGSLGLVLIQAPSLSAIGLALLLAQAFAVAMVFSIKLAAHRRSAR